MRSASHTPAKPERTRLAEVSARIKAHALELGFQKVGIVRAESLSNELQQLEEWLRRGYHGEMEWMARAPTQRTDPCHLFPAACSVVGVALNYYPPDEHSDNPGKVPRYARRDHYAEDPADTL